MPKIPDIAIEATSTIAGAGAAYQAGDPSAGYAVSEFLSSGLRGLLNHFSSQRQSKRITNVTAFALNEIRRRLEDGERLRDDGFFDKTVDRSDAEEVFEDVLLKARDEPQEKKIPYIGSLFENGCFDTSIDSGTLHFLCQESESLTYRQLCIIKIANEKKYKLRYVSVEGHNRHKKEPPFYSLPTEKIHVLTECVSLSTKEFIKFDISHLNTVTAETWYVLIPNSIEPLPAGQMIYEHMKLKSIPEVDVLPVIKALS